MRIGFFHPTLLKGGGERLAAILMNGLIEKGHDIALAGIKPMGFDISPKIQTHYLNSKFPLKPLLFIFVVLKLIFSFKPHVLFFSRLLGLSASFVATILSFICPIPRLIYINVRLDAALMGTSGFRGVGIIKKAVLRFFNFLDIFFSIVGMKRAKFVLVNSQFSKELIKWGKTRVIFPPLDSEKFKPDLSKKENNLIIYVSRYAPEKKQDLALRLFKQINKEGAYNLCLIGHPSFGGFYQNLKEISKKISGSKLIADVPEKELIDYYQRATILWFLRRGEPFGLVPVEGMACGTIPVAMRGGGVSETIVNNESGLLCDSYSDLISKTKIVLGDLDLRQRLIKGAIKRARFFRKEIFINKCEKAVLQSFYHFNDHKKHL